jgi:hypothetical protein
LKAANKRQTTKRIKIKKLKPMETEEDCVEVKQPIDVVSVASDSDATAVSPIDTATIHNKKVANVPTVKDILGIQPDDDDNEFKYIVVLSDNSQKLFERKHARELFPQILIDFFENNLVWVAPQ